MFFLATEIFNFLSETKNKGKAQKIVFISPSKREIFHIFRRLMEKFLI